MSEIDKVRQDCLEIMCNKHVGVGRYFILGRVICGDCLDAERAEHAKEVADLHQQVYEIKKVYNALSGPRAHQLGCDCGGKNRSGYTCKQFYDLMKKD